MDRDFRLATIQHLLKQAGIVSDTVEKALNIAPTTSTYQAIGSVGKGTTVMVPENPIKPDGSVDIIFQIRGIAGGDTKTASSTGTQAVIITAEAGGMGSKENLAAYGDPGFINQGVDKIIQSLKKMNPQAHLGKLTISSFSGGGSATAQLLMNRDKLPQGASAPKFCFIDGLHTDPNSNVMKAVVDYAKEVKKDPSKGELAIVHSAVIPGKYSSTTEVTNHLLNQLGVKREKLSGKEGEPVSQAQAGGLKVVQLYETPQPYEVKDPKTGQMKHNIPGTAGWQHIQSLQWGLRNLLR